MNKAATPGRLTEKSIK